MSAVVAERLREPARDAHGAAGWILAQPFLIGGVEVPNRVVQPPLAGIANWPFRRQSRRHGAGLVVSEMLASYGLQHENRRTVDMLRIVPDEHPMAVQLFGPDPAVMAEAARRVEAAGADLVDVNMGCPVRKVCRTGAGAALLGDIDQAARVVEAMVRAVGIPVTVKMRRGLTPESAEPVRAARALESAGAAALCVHPRAAAEEYAGRADHAITGEVAAAVRIPVIASGDIASPARARSLVESGACTAVAIGRAALGNPWVFRAMATGDAVHTPSLREVAEEVRLFAEDESAALGEHRACHYMRRLYAWYMAAHAVPKSAIERLCQAPTLHEALAILNGLAGDAEPVRPAVAAA